MIKQIIQSLVPLYFTTLIPKNLNLIWLDYIIVYNNQTILAQTLSRKILNMVTETPTQSQMDSQAKCFWQ